MNLFITFIWLTFNVQILTGKAFRCMLSDSRLYERFLLILLQTSLTLPITIGDFWQSWEKGAAVFEEFLLDAGLLFHY